MIETILTRKIGVFELLLVAFAFELAVGTRPRAILVFVLLLVAYYTKGRFAGEFSLRDLGGVWLGDSKPTGAGPNRNNEDTHE